MRTRFRGLEHGSGSRFMVEFEMPITHTTERLTRKSNRQIHS